MRFSFLMALGLALQASMVTAAPRIPNPSAIDAKARELMEKEEVVGMALAVIDRGRIGHVAAYGYRNRERELPLATDTVMYGASLTKPAFAYLVLMLVDERRFDLDRPLYKYLDKPIPAYGDWKALEGDERWRKLTARHVLTHSPGFANFRWLEEDDTLRFHFDPGDRYAYSGEGFELLQFVLEKGLGIDVGEAMQARIFEPFEMERTAMTWRARFADNVADGYAADGSFEPHDRREGVSAAGSMDTTIEDQARLWSGIVRGRGLSPGLRDELVKPQLPIHSAYQFPTLYTEADPRPPRIDLAAGLGVVTYGSVSNKTWFKGGHDRWTGNMLVCREAVKRCVVLLANSVRAELVYPEMVEFVLGDVGMPWWWEYHLD